MMRRAEKALSTHDEQRYDLREHNPAKPIPAFSTDGRKGAKGLHREIVAGNLQYSRLPQFDDETGGDITGDPKRMLIKAKEEMTFVIHPAERTTYFGNQITQTSDTDY